MNNPTPIYDAEANEPLLRGIQAAVDFSTDAEFEGLTDAYVSGLDALADGNLDSAKEFGLSLLEGLLAVERRLIANDISGWDGEPVEPFKGGRDAG